MRTLAALTVAAAMLFGTAAAQATTGRQAKGLIVSAILKSNKVSDKTQPWKTKLGGKAGDAVRPFTASNVRTVLMPGMVGPGLVGGIHVHAGGIVQGTIDLKTNTVSVTGPMSLAKGIK